MKNKKTIMVSTLSAFGAIAAVAFPIAATISCGSSSKNESEPAHKYAKDVVVSGAAKKITDNFGDGNFINPELTYKISQRNLMEQKTRHASGQPFSIHYDMSDVAQWTAGKDTDDAYNVSTIKLKDRKLAAKILDSQGPKELQILGCLAKNASQTETGTVSKGNVNDAVFQMWSHVHSFVGWGGSASEGNFMVPKGNDINAAHRNGVPLLGTLFLPPNRYGGKAESYDQMCKKQGDKYPVADKMIEMAQHFGFDGWFLNFESTGKTDADIGGFLKYLHEGMQKAKLFTVLYDFGAGKSYMNDADNIPFDQAALDYGSWNAKYAVPEEQESFGYDYDVNATDRNNDNFKDKNIWMYTYFKRHDAINGDNVDLQTFSDVDGSRDPRATTSKTWKGLSTYFQANTPIVSRDVFSTSFETGIGSKFYIDGKEQTLGSQLTTDGYRNQGLQDVLPTYTYINDEYSSTNSFTTATRVSTPGTAIEDDGATWISQIDETGTPFYGSSNLHYTGKISAGNTIINRLYGSDVALKTGDKFSTVVDTTKDNVNLALWTQDTYDTDIVEEHANNVLKAINSEDLGNGLTRVNYTVPKDLDGKVMSSFGLAFTNAGTDTIDVDYHVGQLSYKPAEAVEASDEIATEATTTTAVESTNVLTQLNSDGNFLFMNKRNLRVNWAMTDNSEVDHYVVWSTTGTSKDDFAKKEILTVTTLPAAFLQDVDTKSTLNIVIDAIDADDNIISSNKAAVKTTFKAMDDKSKWTESFERPTDQGAVYTLATGNGYTTSFKDTNGDMYFADDYTRVYKITADGTFRTSGDESWGSPVATDFKDMKTLKLFDLDDKTLGMITKDGMLYFLDKESGKQAKKPIDIIKKDMDVPPDPQHRPDFLQSVEYAAMKDGKLTLFATGNNQYYLTARLEGLDTDAPKLTWFHSASQITSITKNSAGTYTIAFIDGYGEIGVRDIKSVEDFDFSNLGTEMGVVDGFRNFTKSAEFKAIFGDEFFGNVGDNQNLMTTFGEGKIKYAKKLKTGNTLIVNEYGLAMLVDEKGAPVPQKDANGNIIIAKKADGTVINDWQGKPTPAAKVISLLDKTTWDQFAKSVADFANGGSSMQGFASIGNKENLLTALSIKMPLLIGQVSFDESTNQIQSLVANGIKFKYIGRVDSKTKFIVNDLTDFINDPSNDAGTPVIKELTPPDDKNKQIGGVTFVEEVGGVIVMGGADCKIAVYDKEFNQLPIGEKVYSYDGNPIQTMQKIYDDKDQSIPTELIG